MHPTPEVTPPAQLQRPSANPGQFTTSRGFLSADKYLEDASFYNDYTYVIRVGESFDRYKDILLKLVHPAGFQPLGRFVDVLEAPVTIPPASMAERTRTELPLGMLIGDPGWGNGPTEPATIISLETAHDGTVDI